MLNVIVQSVNQFSCKTQKKYLREAFCNFAHMSSYYLTIHAVDAMTLSTMTLSMVELIVTLRLEDHQHYVTQNSSKTQHNDTLMCTQSVIMLNVILLSVLAPQFQFSCQTQKKYWRVAFCGFECMSSSNICLLLKNDATVLSMMTLNIMTLSKMTPSITEFIMTLRMNAN